MATDIVQGLFGMTPESYQMNQQAAAREQAAKFASMDPFQQANYGLYLGGNQLGGAIGGMLGAQDPMLQRASAIRSLAQGIDITSAKGLEEYANRLQQNGLSAEAAQLGQVIASRRQQEAELSKTTAEAARGTIAAEREDKLQQELAKLPEDATEEQTMAVLRKYGDPKTALMSMEASQRKKFEIQARQDDLKSRLEAQIQMAKDRGATQKEIAEMQIQGRKDLAAFAASLKANQPKFLPASLQKSEDEDLSKVDSFQAQREALAPSIQALTPDPTTGKVALELSPGKIAGYAYQLATGKSTPEARSYERLKSAVDTAVNLQVSAEKGVQTDADVLRFAKALIASYGRNDTKATLEALTRFNEAIQTSENKTKQRINSRRSSQGVEPYYIAGQNINVPPANAPMATPAAPTAQKPTHRFNPATGRVEAL